MAFQWQNEGIKGKVANTRADLNPKYCEQDQQVHGILQKDKIKVWKAVAIN